MTDEMLEEETALGKYKRSPNFTVIFTNNVNFAYTPVDIQMVCSRTMASMDKNVKDIEEIATIIMTPQHAKAVLDALQGNIRAYEKVHGEIKMPIIANSTQPIKEQQVLASASRKNKR